VTGLLIASLPEVATVTSLTYQPFAPGVPELTERAADGPDLSSLTIRGEALALSPAALVQDPFIVVPEVGVVMICGGVQLTGPLIESVPAVETVTSLMYQPWSPEVPEVMERAAVGGVVSRLMVTDWEMVPPALVAVQVKVAPPVSVLTLPAPHPEVDVTLESGSLTIQPIPTLLTYHPLAPRVPVTVGAITGGVLSHDPVTPKEMLELTPL
jgi:hypothetical protein